MPRGVSDEVVRAWARAGVAAHVAFRVGDLRDVLEIGAIMEDEGFVRPEFMAEGPLTNPAAQITLTYFDGQRGGGTLRLGFCHYR